ncbi:hypothetical protein QVD17_11071 [Tagetes erecta]|uniref:Uncharacterized protein n=1 Tax=Tagetes erecta TaxID=13708 RepID=A0AAD8L6Y0_TARER|nr:hypothetical protein QVD17_11071 [Tagetes erecta]
MDNFNTSIKGGNKSNNENELNPQMNCRLKSPSKKQLPTKNFMSPTISAAVKASGAPRKKILGERNETVESTSLQRSSSFGSKSVRSSVVDYDDVVEKCFVGESGLQPYDPVKNYLSPRPKFLRYNPNRRRNRIMNLQENNDEDQVKISTYYKAGSCSPQEYVDEAPDAKNEVEDENGEECEGEDDDDDDEEEMDEFVEDRCCSLKGFFKFLFVVIAVILTTQAICSMNAQSNSTSLGSVWHNGVCGLNSSEVGYGLIMEPDLLVGRLKEVFVDLGHKDEVENDDSNEEVVHQDEVGKDESNVIIQEHETEANEVIKTDYVEVETDQDFKEDDLIEEVDSDANEMNLELTNEAEFEFENDMADEVEKEFNDITTKDMLIKLSSIDITLALVIGHILILTSFGVIYLSKCNKSSSTSVTTPIEQEEFKDLDEPSTNPQSSMQHQETVSSKVNIPSVELLGEFVFGEEQITSFISTENHPTNSLIQTTTVSSNQTKSSHIAISTCDSNTVKKQRRKLAEVVTPSPVRRSSRLKTRSIIMSP